MRRTIRTILFAIGLTATSAIAAPPVFFRSDRGLAEASNRPLPEKVDTAESLVWKTPLAQGHSTPCVCGDAIYVTTFADGKLATVALDRATGAVRWTRGCPAEKTENFHPTGSPAAASPAGDGERVYSMFGSYGLLCYDTAGKLVWEKRLGPFQDEFGAASSPVLAGAKLVLAQDHDVGSFLLCVETATGKTLWQVARPDAVRSYSTPIVVEVAGRSQVVLAGALSLSSYDLETGALLWTYDGLARIVNTTPVAVGDVLYLAAWTPGGDSESRIAMELWPSAVTKWDKNADSKLARDEIANAEVLDRYFRIDVNQDQQLDQAEWEKYARVFDLAKNSALALKLRGRGPPELLWQYERGIPYVASPLVYENVVYLAKDGGIITALDAPTGKLLKQFRASGASNFYASPVAGDGKLYLLAERGGLTVLKAAAPWDVLSRRDFDERAIATPVLAGSRLYVRTEKALYCFGKK